MALNSPVVYALMLLVSATGSSLAYYRGGYDFRVLDTREEPQDSDEGELVECPVCTPRNDSYLVIEETCTVLADNKMYKRCRFGTYVNERCGGRLDCYRGPGEKCTVKMYRDYYGHKCGPGFYCQPNDNTCHYHTHDTTKATAKKLHYYRLTRGQFA